VTAGVAASPRRVELSTREVLARTCDSRGEPMLPNLSQADADGCLWICIDPDCPELCAGELETEDLAGGGVSTSWGTGSDVEDQALAGRLVRLIDYYEDTIEELRAKYGGEGEEGADAGGGAAAPPPAGSRERAQADLASLRRQVRELRRRSALAAAAARQLGLELVVSYHSDEFGRGPGSPAPPRRHRPRAARPPQGGPTSGHAADHRPRREVIVTLAGTLCVPQTSRMAASLACKVPLPTPSGPPSEVAIR